MAPYVPPLEPYLPLFDHDHIYYVFSPRVCHTLNLFCHMYNNLVIFNLIWLYTARLAILFPWHKYWHSVCTFINCSQAVNLHLKNIWIPISHIVTLTIPYPKLQSIFHIPYICKEKIFRTPTNINMNIVINMWLIIILVYYFVSVVDHSYTMHRTSTQGA